MEPADRQGAAIETTPRKNIRIPTHLAVSVNNVQFDIGKVEFASGLSEEAYSSARSNHTRHHHR